MEIRRLTEVDSSGLDEFVQSHPHGSVEQSWDWGVLQQSIPGRDSFYVLGAFKNEKMVGSVLVIRQSMGHGKTWLWCPRGPLLPEKGEDVWAHLKAELDEIADEAGDVYLRVEPGVPAGEMWAVQGVESKEQYLPRHTLTIDLTESEDGIRKQMAQKGRYNIKKAAKAGVYVLKSDLMDFDDFFAVLSETASRDGFHLHDEKFYREFVEILEDAHLYVAYIDHELVGGMMVTHFGDTATYYFGASSNAHRNAMAPYALQWFAMQEAKKAGLKRYDFLGIAPPDDKKHPLTGVTQFKTRFGGERVEYHFAQVFVYRPLWWKLIKLVKRFR